MPSISQCPSILSKSFRRFRLFQEPQHVLMPFRPILGGIVGLAKLPIVGIPPRLFPVNECHNPGRRIRVDHNVTRMQIRMGKSHSCVIRKFLAIRIWDFPWLHSRPMLLDALPDHQREPVMKLLDRGEWPGGRPIWMGDGDVVVRRPIDSALGVIRLSSTDHLCGRVQSRTEKMITGFLR